MSQMEQYHSLVNRVIATGVDREDRTGVGTRSLFGEQLRFNNVGEEFPLLTTKKVYLNGVITELLWFLSGNTNDQYLRSNKTRIWKDWAIDEVLDSSSNYFKEAIRVGDLGPIYSAQWRRWPTTSSRSIVTERRYGPIGGSVKLPYYAYVDSLLPQVDTLDKAYFENYDSPFNVIGITSEGKFRIQFIKTRSVTTIDKELLISETKVEDKYEPIICDVACIGNVDDTNNEVYALWISIIYRCYKSDSAAFVHYGGKGFYVSPRWLCYENFQEDISKIPNYEKWAIESYNYTLDVNYYQSYCYDVSTVVFLPRSIVIKTDSITEIISPSGSSKICTDTTEVYRFLNTSLEASTSYKHGRPYSNGWDFRTPELPDNNIIRKELYIDQMSVLLKNLKERPFSRRHVVTAWNPEDLPDESISPQDNVRQGRMAIAPCHCLFQFYVEYMYKDGVKVTDSSGKPILRLSLQLYQRSADLIVGTPFNIPSYSLLLMMVAQCVDMVPGDFIYTLGDAHIYLNHIDTWNTIQSTRTHYKAPKVLLNPEVKDLFSFKSSDIRIESYASHESIKYNIAI